eukprot:GDKK01062892.1.p1 GENE.GDKK01062892.1~~GDKK01062892.1.p1  ORF type:complete len:102 (-),score=0.79 GDKK01062892.1:73-378(-)
MGRASKTVEEVAKESNSTNNHVGYDKYAGTDTIDTVLEDDLPARESCTETTFVAETPTEPGLEDCLCYLRDVHYYCYYCGAGYTDADDLLNNCPGLSEDDH